MIRSLLAILSALAIAYLYVARYRQRRRANQYASGNVACNEEGFDISEWGRLPLTRAHINEVIKRADAEGRPFTVREIEAFYRQQQDEWPELNEYINERERRHNEQR